MKILIIGLFIFLCAMFPHFRNIVLHPIQTIKNAPLDIYKYIKYKRWRECHAYGYIDMFCSNIARVFGNGKTLSGANVVINIYNDYNGKMIYDFDDNEWIEQRIIILSNVKFHNIPYEHLTKADQIVKRHETMKKGEVLIVYVDEAGILFNSRNFKENIGYDLLNAMLTCRKKKFCMYFTAQRFNQVDALIRQLTSRVIMCEKWWRSVVLSVYNGFDMEYCVNPQHLNCNIVTYFATNRLYSSYDTDQGVEDLKKAKKNGEMLSDKEILENQGVGSTDIHNANLNEKYYKKVVRK